jgi:hypothetical protein
MEVSNGECSASTPTVRQIERPRFEIVRRNLLDERQRLPPLALPIGLREIQHRLRHVDADEAVDAAARGAAGSAADVQHIDRAAESVADAQSK